MSGPLRSRGLDQSLDADRFENAFNTKEIRNNFVRKVYMILTGQLMIVVSFVLFFVFHQPTQKWMVKHIYMLYISVAVSIGTVILLVCFTKIRRRAPMNFIFLAFFTVAQGIMMGMLASCFAPYPVLMAVSLTAIITLVLSVFALQTKYDFTGMGGFLISFTLPVIVLGIVYIFFRHQFLEYACAAFTCMLYCCYLVYDTQLMLKGKQTYSLTPDDYVFAALNLYVDISNIFMVILNLFRSRRSED